MQTNTSHRPCKKRIYSRNTIDIFPDILYHKSTLIFLRKKANAMNKNEIILYETSDHSVKLNVSTDGSTVWLNRAQLAELFGRDVKTIGKHVNNRTPRKLI